MHNIIQTAVVLSLAAPGTPTAPDVEAKFCHTLNVTWSPPEQTGGLPITGYNISYTDTTNTMKICPCYLLNTVRTR